MDRQPFIIAELEDLSSLAAPLKSTTRIKYTCFNVSANLLVMGASSGGLYVFRREPCVFLQLIPSKEGAITQVAVSPDERLLGMATARGTVSLVERNQRGARVVASSYEHSDSVVTALAWGGGELFIGDARGRVSVLARTVFQPPAALLMQLDSQVVQLDAKDRLLVVSTMTRCYVCDTERELFRQVGVKLRDGMFGGCFITSEWTDESSEPKTTERARGTFSHGGETSLLSSDGKTTPDYSNLRHLRLFCARPGARIWEGDVEGTVLKTHNFKEAISSPARPITTDRTIDNNNTKVAKNNQQAVNFGRLLNISSRFLVSHSSDAIYVLDPERYVWDCRSQPQRVIRKFLFENRGYFSRIRGLNKESYEEIGLEYFSKLYVSRSDILLWCNQIEDIVDTRVADNVIYVWCGSGKMHALNLVPLEKFLIRMYFWKKYLMVTELCLEFSEFLKNQAPHSTKLHLLKDLDEKLKDHKEWTPEVDAALSPLLEILRCNAQHTQVQNARKLKSGIYQISRPNFLNLKNRSHSVSPDRVGSLRSGGSTSSLPELVMEEEENTTGDIFVDADKELVGDVLELCPRMQVSSPRPEEVRELLHRVLRLCDANDPLSSARELPIRKIFSNECTSAIAKAFRTALTSHTVVALLKDLPAPHSNGKPARSEENGEKKMHHDNNSQQARPKNEFSQLITRVATEEKSQNLMLSHPKFLIDHLEPDMLEIDLKMSRALVIFGDILKEDEILDAVKAALPHCYYLSLLQITKKFEAVETGLTENLSQPKALSVVSFLLKVGQVDQICRWSQKLVVRDIAYLVMRREDEDGRSARVLFLSALDGWRASGDADYQSEEKYLIHCLSALPQGKACECGFPVPEANKHSSARFSNLGAEILKLKADPAEAVRICGIIPWLWPHLLRMRSEDGLIKLLPLIIHLGDLEELEQRLPELDSLSCEILVRHLAGLHRGDCLNCGRRLADSTPGISWTQAAMLLVKAVGHSETLKLLSQYKADVYGLEPVFHRAVVLAAIMEKHSTGLRHSVVDIFSGRSSRQTSMLSPTLQAEIFPSTPVTPGPSHWGLKLDTNGSLCPACSLLLSAKVLTEAGVIAFPCKHAFHAVCLRARDHCPVCSEE